MSTKKNLMMVLATAFIMLPAAAMLTGCDKPVNPTLCIPCGDFAINCGGDPGCPTCYSMNIDEGTGEFSTETRYENGSYAITTMEGDASVTTYYKSGGAVCYTMSVDTQSGEMTYDIGGKTYTVVDGDTWTCPDNTTWTMPEECKADCEGDNCGDGGNNGGDQNQGDNCTDMMSLPQCS